MKKLYFLLLALLIAGCCTAYNSTNNDAFAGEWIMTYHGGISSLEITKHDPLTYDIKCIGKDKKDTTQWNGIGRQINNQLLAIFKYLGIAQQGYITFTMTNLNTLEFESMNPDGSIRSKGYYVRQK